MDRHEGPYTCVELRITADRVDVASGVLWDHDPLGVEEVEERAGAILLRGYFPPGAEAASAIADLEEVSGTPVTVRSVPKEDWFRLFRESFRPFEAIPGVGIRPPWEPRPEPAPELDLVIEPGAAFGTGLHETTRSAMELMDPFLREGSRMIDVGSGSGILAIYARKRGARALALEIDPEAIDNLVKNRGLNGLGAPGELPVVCGGPSAIGGPPFDVVAANLTLEIHALQREELARLAGARGILVLAGMLLERREAAVALARQLGRIEHESVRGEWLAMAVRASRS